VTSEEIKKILRRIRAGLLHNHKKSDIKGIPSEDL
jgi:hypothetical protein